MFANMKKTSQTPVISDQPYIYDIIAYGSVSLKSFSGCPDPDSPLNQCVIGNVILLGNCGFQLRDKYHENTHDTFLRVNRKATYLKTPAFWLHNL